MLLIIDWDWDVEFAYQVCNFLDDYCLNPLAEGRGDPERLHRDPFLGGMPALYAVACLVFDKIQELAGGLDDKERKHQHELLLEVGIPGKLLRSKDLATVFPLEDDEALAAGLPKFDKAGMHLDAKGLEARHRAMTAKLPKDGVALVVLGGSHDLGPYLGDDVLYIRITPRSYPPE